MTSCLGLNKNTADRLAARGAVADETDSETAGKTLVKKQKSAATPKVKVARAQVFQSVTKKGNNANR